MKFVVSTLQVKSDEIHEQQNRLNVSTTQNHPSSPASASRDSLETLEPGKKHHGNHGKFSKNMQKNSKKLRLPWRITWKCETKLKPLSKTVHFGSQKKIHPTQSHDLTWIFHDPSVKSSGNNTELIELLARFAFAGLQIKFTSCDLSPTVHPSNHPKHSQNIIPPKLSELLPIPHTYHLSTFPALPTTGPRNRLRGTWIL